jgi:hypothetical protein
VLVNARPAAPVTLPRVFAPPTTASFALRTMPIDPPSPSASRPRPPTRPATPGRSTRWWCSWRGSGASRS